MALPVILAVATISVRPACTSNSAPTVLVHGDVQMPVREVVHARVNAHPLIRFPLRAIDRYGVGEPKRELLARSLQLGVVS